MRWMKAKQCVDVENEFHRTYCKGDKMLHLLSKNVGSTMCSDTFGPVQTKMWGALQAYKIAQGEKCFFLDPQNG